MHLLLGLLYALLGHGDLVLVFLLLGLHFLVVLGLELLEDLLDGLLLLVQGEDLLLFGDGFLVEVAELLVSQLFPLLFSLVVLGATEQGVQALGEDHHLVLVALLYD